jgi:hypothetical protein
MPVRERFACARWRREAISRIESDPNVKYVLTSGSVGEEQRLGTDGQWMLDDGSGYETAWKRFLDAGKRVVVIDDVPGLPFYFADCLARKYGNVAGCVL